MTFSFGKEFKIHVFGESHGKCIGVVVEGCPPGLSINTNIIQAELDRRRPGQNKFTTPRLEKDNVKVLSGVLDGKATGAPMTMIIDNMDVNSTSYEDIKDTPRPGHADLTAKMKYNGFNDPRGGGVFSGRMTAAFVMAGAVAKQILARKDIKVLSHVIQIGKSKVCRHISDREIEKNAYANTVHCADFEVAGEMEREIINAKDESDSVGGLIECRIVRMPPGMGEPLFDSVESVLSHAIFSIPAVKGIEFGCGFSCIGMKGSECNDPFIMKDEKIITETNNAGGVLGGISNGMPIVFRVAIKPTPSIAKTQRTVDLKTGKECKLEIKGRHDPCIAIRAVPVVESMAAVVLVDLLMRSKK
ncbi:MAG: chorismate synthase [Candidatus Methanofastidiosia archaeon]